MSAKAGGPSVIASLESDEPADNQRRHQPQRDVEIHAVEKLYLAHTDFSPLGKERFCLSAGAMSMTFVKRPMLASPHAERAEQLTEIHFTTFMSGMTDSMTSPLSRIV